MLIWLLPAHTYQPLKVKHLIMTCFEQKKAGVTDFISLFSKQR
jgi:hypothetical protein